MDSAVWEAQWRAIFERHAANLLTELSAHFRAALRETGNHGERSRRMEARRETAERLNQAVRRLRRTSTQRDSLALLADSTSPYCRRAAVFTLNGESADCACTRGFASSEFQIALADAAAFRSAIESKDPVVAAPAPSEISSTLFEALDDGASESVYLFPMVVRQVVKGILFSAGEVQPAALELLTEAAALRWEAWPAPQPEVANEGDPVQLEGSKSASATEDRKRTAWDQLSPEDQALHLRAQRFARVKAAELRLYHADALRDGRERGELYRAVRPEIDAARAEFYREFIGASPTMVDYFHLELLRSLAHEDDRLLGPEYPGPLV
ncbi:MAG: hypothetical protein ACR2I2_18660 [Bryobacteraceae bacterium]